MKTLQLVGLVLSLWFLPAFSQSCVRDVIIVIDGTDYMLDNIVAEIDLLNELIDSWNISTTEINVALVTYGFSGQYSESELYTDAANVKRALANLRSNASVITQPLSGALSVVNSFYTKTSLNPKFRLRSNAQPRLVVLTSTTNLNDISTSYSYVNVLYNNLYQTILNVAIAPVSLYSAFRFPYVYQVNSLPALNNAYRVLDNITYAVCYNDPRYAGGSTTPVWAPTTASTQFSTVTEPTTLPPSSSSPPSYLNADGFCGCDQSKPNLWIDVAILVDNTAAVTKLDTNNFASFLGSIFDGYNFNSTQGLQVSVISSNNNPALVANYSDIQSNEDIYQATVNLSAIKPTDAPAVDITNSFILASTVLTQGRSNSRKVILYVVTNLPFTVPTVVSQIKENGVVVIVYSVSDGSQSIAQTIASPNMAIFSYHNQNPNGIQDYKFVEPALCYANCFCYKDWHNSKTPFTLSEPIFANCTNAAVWPSSPTVAPLFLDSGCWLAFAKDYPSYQRLLNYYTQANWGTGRAKFLFGLTYVSSLGTWQYADNSTLSSSDYLPWATGNPNTANGNCVAAEQQTGITVNLVTVDCDNYMANYFEQTRPCSVNKYCSSDSPDSS